MNAIKLIANILETCKNIVKDFCKYLITSKNTYDI